MSFPSLRNGDSTPNLGGSYISALLCDALYHQSEDFINFFALQTNSKLELYDDDSTTETPQYALLTAPGEVFVILDGTTNVPQWLGHAGAILVPGVDVDVPLDFVIPSVAVVNAFWKSEVSIIQPILWPFLIANAAVKVKIIGHSYGAACAHILGRWLANSNQFTGTVEILTFGEPRAYDGRPAKKEPDWHARIITAAIPFNVDSRSYVDPVTMMPPGMWSVNNLGIRWKVLKSLYSLSWGHFGNPWLLSASSFLPGENLIPILDFIPGQEWARVVSGLPFQEFHKMDIGYLPFLRKTIERVGSFVVELPSSPTKTSAPNNQINLTDFDNYYTEWTNNPVTPPATIGPPVSTNVANQGYQLATPNVVTPQNYYDWGVVSASATLADSQTSIPYLLNGGGGGVGISGTSGGGLRTWWLYRGRDRNMIESLLKVLNAILTRDDKAKPNVPQILPPADSDVFQATVTLIYWLQFLLKLDRSNITK